MHEVRYIVHSIADRGPFTHELIENRVFVFQKENYLCTPVFGKVLTKYADVVKLVDTPDLGSGAVRCVGSSPSIRT